MATNYPTTLDSFAAKTADVDSPMSKYVNDMREAVEVLEAKVGIDTSAVSTSLDYKVNNFFVENTRMMWFYENTAPTGWTTATDLSASDAVLAIKGGSNDYNVNGGNVAGSWLTATHTLSVAEMAPHQHSYTGRSGTSIAITSVSAVRSLSNTTTTGSTGGDCSHNHGNTYRPYAAIGLLAQYTGA